jgi:hypothetical protein
MTPSGRERWRWAFMLVPAVGLLELCLHVKQANSAPSEQDWAAARSALEQTVKPDDLVVFAPRWIDPLAREHFGTQIASLEREARPDETRFPRAIEVSVRGMHAPELSSWRKAGEWKTGPFTLTALENPAPAKVIDDLVVHATPEHTRVSRVDPLGRETDCAFAHAGPQTGGLGFGPAVPGDRWTCPGGFVGISVVPDLDYKPHKCIYAPPSGGPSPVRIRFVDVAFGTSLYGHHGLYVEAERHRDGAPVTLVWKTDARTLGSVTHNDGDGWKRFELPTSDLAGTRGDLVAEITAPNGNRRMYCFEADTR